MNVDSMIADLKIMKPYVGNNSSYVERPEVESYLVYDLRGDKTPTPKEVQKLLCFFYSEDDRRFILIV